MRLNEIMLVFSTRNMFGFNQYNTKYQCKLEAQPKRKKKKKFFFSSTHIFNYFT